MQGRGRGKGGKHDFILILPPLFRDSTNFFISLVDANLTAWKFCRHCVHNEFRFSLWAAAVAGLKGAKACFVPSLFASVCRLLLP